MENSLQMRRLLSSTPVPLIALQPLYFTLVLNNTSCIMQNQHHLIAEGISQNMLFLFQGSFIRIWKEDILIWPVFAYE